MSSATQWTRHNKVKAGIWAVGFAVVIMVGSLTGAQLKQDKQKEEAIRSFREIGPEEQIAMLQDQRGHLLDQKVMLQRKLDAFHETVQDRAREKQAKADRK